MSRCSSANTFRGSGVPSGVCTVARRSAALRRVGLKLRTPSRASVAFIRLTMRVRSPTRHSRSRFGRLASSSAIVGTRAMLQWPRSPRSHPKNPRFSNSVSSRSVLARRCSRDTATLEAWITCASTPRALTQPARQPEAIAAGFEGQRNPRDLAAGLDRLVAPAMQQAKQPFCTRLQLLARLALNAGKHTGNQPTRLAHLDDGNDCAILVQGDEGPAQVVRLGHRGTPSVSHSDDGAISSPPAPYHLSAGGNRIRTRGPVSGGEPARTNELSSHHNCGGRSELSPNLMRDECLQFLPQHRRDPG